MNSTRLPGLSQIAGVVEAKALEEGGTGHGCGHNLLGTGSLHGGESPLPVISRENDLPGTVRYYGCPGEEGGSGKTFMARAGAFADVDAALTWHPAPFNGVRSTNNLAVLEYLLSFQGGRRPCRERRPSRPERRSMRVELMNVGVNFLREHMPQDCRVHYAITDAGGRAANVVQARAEALYLDACTANA